MEQYQQCCLLREVLCLPNPVRSDPSMLLLNKALLTVHTVLIEKMTCLTNILRVTQRNRHCNSPVLCFPLVDSFAADFPTLEVKKEFRIIEKTKKFLKFIFGITQGNIWINIRKPH